MLLVLVMVLAVTLHAASSLVIPYELHKDIIVVNTNINGQQLSMAVDSGLRNSTFDVPAAKALGIQPDKKALVEAGPAGRLEIGIAENVAINFQGMKFDAALVKVYSLDFLSKRIGKHLDGILGIEIFQPKVVEIDYHKQVLRLWEPDAFVAGSGAVILPVTYYKTLPVVEATLFVQGLPPIDTKLQLDSGATGVSVVLWKEFLERHKIEPHLQEVKVTEEFGFGGGSQTSSGAVEELRVGGVVTTKATVRLSKRISGEPSVGGNLGSSWYRSVSPIVFDLSHNRVIVYPKK